MNAESLAKAYILTHGVHFTPEALQHAITANAKRQNAVYNLPALALESSGSGSSSDRSINLIAPKFSRPQELFLTGGDGYTVCVSAVAPVPERQCAIVDFTSNQLTLETPGMPKIGVCVNEVRYVPQPSYYDKVTSSGRPVTRIVSACGYDEMNIWPWHDCAISKTCSFCGINAVHKQAGKNNDLLRAVTLRQAQNPSDYWNSQKESILSELSEAIDLAIDDDCYKEEIHLILITGNLADDQLDLQALIYSDIARAINAKHSGKFAEGLVAVTAPPSDSNKLFEMRDAGVSIGVFNLEAYTPTAFALHCPGKHRLGRDLYLNALNKGVEVFGWGKSWSNFVLGLEPASDLLQGAENLAAHGITPGANVLHCDHGAPIKVTPPTYETVISFYRELAILYNKYNHKPYYCQKALRTSLANEAYSGRF